MKTKTISKEKAKELINKSNGRIFSSVFIKKDGTHRLMNARLGVKKYIRERTRATLPDIKKRKWKPSEYNLIQVYDMTHAKNYRMINLNTMLELNINKTKYKIK
tara:strand:+ start:471 stop:782 length:312 start_codon:yes stop_codon:yes gene_type:complete